MTTIEAATTTTPSAGPARERPLWTIVDSLPMFARAWLDAPATAPTYVLVHGLGASSRYMVPLGRELSRAARVYAPDIPGFGRSLAPPVVLDMAGQADAIAGWMRAADIGPAVLVGNSLGCQAIVQFALRHSDLLLRAVLVGPTFDSQARAVLPQVARLLRDALHEPLSLNLIETIDYLKAGPLRVWRTLQFGLHQPENSELRRVPVPVLVVRGGADPIVPQRWVKEMTSLLPCARLDVIPGAAHAVNYNSPRRLAAVIEAFMALDPLRGNCG